jgi:hypothetical protein
MRARRSATVVLHHLPPSAVGTRQAFKQAALLQTTLLDQNVARATSVVSGGNVSTYGNNSTIGNAGSGFNHTAGLQ